MRIESIKEISLLENERKIYDIIVVGGGPAGMTAALYGARNGKSVLILEKNGFGGQMVYSPRIENFPSRLSVSGSELADEMVGQIIEQGVEPGVERVTAVRDEGAVKAVATDDGEHYARTVIIAAGVKHRMLGLEGEEQLVGSGISFCAVCDGEFFRGKRVAVAGGGNSALQEAILLSEYCERVTVVQDMDFLTGEQKSQDVLKAKENVDIITGTTITALRSEDGLLKYIREALPKCAKPPIVCTLGEPHTDEGFVDYGAELYAASDVWERPQGADDAQNDDRMLLYFSSGTSGMPKMVWHDYAYPLGHIATAKYWHCVRENTIHMTQTDSGWAKFAWGKIYGQWICGAAIGAYDTMKFKPQDMLDAICRIKPTPFCAPATIYRILIKDDLSGHDLSFIKNATVAGEPLNPEVYNKIIELTGLEIREGFGQTETPGLCANFPFFEVRPGSMGKPNPYFDVQLLDENDEPCEDGIEGVISICGVGDHGPSGLFRGYYKNPEATNELWHGGIYRTGDMARRDADGYYWFVGRNDDVIKCSGYRIGPFEVESALMEHQSVLECAVTAYPDPDRGEIVKATIVLAKGYEPSPELVKELQNHVKQATAPYKYPRRVEFVSPEDMPKTSSGKIQRKVIRERDLKKYKEENGQA